MLELWLKHMLSKVHALLLFSNRCQLRHFSSLSLIGLLSLQLVLIVSRFLSHKFLHILELVEFPPYFACVQVVQHPGDSRCLVLQTNIIVFLLIFKVLLTLLFLKGFCGTLSVKGQLLIIILFTIFLVSKPNYLKFHFFLKCHRHGWRLTLCFLHSLLQSVLIHVYGSKFCVFVLLYLDALPMVLVSVL